MVFFFETLNLEDQLQTQPHGANAARTEHRVARSLVWGSATAAENCRLQGMRGLERELRSNKYQTVALVYLIE